MVRKVVIPATISVRTVVLFSLSLKSCSNIHFSPVCRCVECAGKGLCKASLAGRRFAFAGPVSYSPRPAGRARPEDSDNHADEPVFPADPQGDAGGSADRLAPADA